MDRKSITILAVSFVLLVFVWPQLVEKMYPPITKPATTNTVAGASNQLAHATNATAAVSKTNAAAPATTDAPAPKPSPAITKGPEHTEVLEDADARYTFTSHGGGLKLVEMKAYPASIACGKNGTTTNLGLARLNADAHEAVLTLLSPDSTLSEGAYTLTKISPDGLRAVQVLANGLEVTKEFHLNTNYLFSGSVTLKNTSGKAITVPAHEVVVGTASASGPKDDPTLMGVFWYNGSKMEQVLETWFANKSFGCGPSNPRSDYEGGDSNVVWSAANNQFFTFAAIPKTPAPKVRVLRFEVPLPKGEPPPRTGTPNLYQTAFAYPAQTLPPGEASVREFEFYAGPKEYNTLARIGSHQANNLDLVMKLNGFFGFFSKFLLLAMNGLHQFGLPYGWAIIAITVIIKVLFWPLTRASTRSMKRMSALQPQMKALQEKYKDDPQKMNQKLMEFYKEHKVNPVGGCLPMLLQMPVFFGFFFMIRSAIELRGAHFLWACDLSSSDTIFTIPGIGFPINPMPLIMGVTMLVQAQMTPPSPGVDPVQQKIMKYMPLMFMVFLYNYSAGLTLYWTVQNLLTIVQMKLTKNDDPTVTGSAAGGSKPAGPSPAVAAAKKKKRN